MSLPLPLQYFALSLTSLFDSLECKNEEQTNYYKMHVNQISMPTTAVAAIILMAASRASAEFCEAFIPQPFEVCIPDYPCYNTTLSTGAKNNVSYRLSGADVCDVDSPFYYPDCALGGCIMQPQGDILITQPSVTNITLPDDEFAALFSLVSQAVNKTFELSVTVNESAGVRNGMCEDLGMAYFLGTSPEFECVDGVLEGCDSCASVADGTAVRACQPLSHFPFWNVVISNDTADSIGPGPAPTAVQPFSLLDTGIRTGRFDADVLTPSPLPSSYITMAPASTPTMYY